MDPLFQVIISLVILLLMGYFAYNVYVIELHKLLKSTSGTKQQVDVFTGILDFKNTEFVYDTFDKSKDNYLDVSPSINQQGGAEYSYNFWLYNDIDALDITKDYAIILKGEKKFYYSQKNFNCANRLSGADANIGSKHYNIMIKNPLVRLAKDNNKVAIVVEYNNINNVDSYQNTANINCDAINDADDWKNKNKNLLGIYDIDFNKKWYMVSIVMKEVADRSNILLKKEASCKMYVNGINVMDRKVKTRYGADVYSATFKNNKSPLYINPDFSEAKYQVYNKIRDTEVLKMADLKYYNYAITETEIAKLYASGFSKSIASQPKSSEVRYNIVSISEMETEDKQVKQI